MRDEGAGVYRSRLKYGLKEASKYGVKQPSLSARPTYSVVLNFNPKRDVHAGQSSLQSPSYSTASKVSSHSGAHGLLQKTRASSELTPALQSIIAGEGYFN